ncbi:MULTISPECIES: TetR family transcriptional regulator [Cellulophaga]|uniref:Biofilm operon icaADBC HTH-type negative transcriptional regulator IcaR n=1 Tax=Cellulophaga baltica TaxID=76594 RepID=A0A1G7EL85_9FLAO|nr:TetR family transcriptional regulator [Cellulophaga baltica]AIY11949.1 TetR family transcriptional regulator [Cellulophaga baltica NN016038]MBA6314250.1 TetR/AcrR family transcriptional regulator [Cellulophaga baltica]SDE64384.1 transcriptional regulator, TetR family [Cellulophaga baltica]
MGRKSVSVARRKEIIKAFYKVAKEIGLENTSIAKVAEDLSISNGLIMHYFKTKDELLIGLNEFILEQHLNIVQNDENGIIDTKQKLHNLITSLFSRNWNKYFDDGVFYSCYALIYRKKDFNDSFKSYLQALHTVLATKLIEAKENGIICNEDIHEITEIIFALIDGAYYYLGTFNENTEDYKKKELVYIKYALNILDFMD